MDNDIVNSFETSDLGIMFDNFDHSAASYAALLGVHYGAHTGDGGDGSVPPDLLGEIFLFEDMQDFLGDMGGVALSVRTECYEPLTDAGGQVQIGNATDDRHLTSTDTAQSSAGPALIHRPIQAGSAYLELVTSELEDNYGGGMPLSSETQLRISSLVAKAPTYLISDWGVSLEGAMGWANALDDLIGVALTFHQQGVLTQDTASAIGECLLSNSALAHGMYMQDQALWQLIASTRAKFETVFDPDDRTKFKGITIRPWARVPMDMEPAV
ncbi:hypothetical protein CALCODRAFT_55405 [Calocera cornea HHB12733]|uniref:Uncharacterized protein n=1 Tax=Calocera cornea HHB12733 TaxID=1353952 RepID=A0A165DQJ6_9BASI|nr:hypothetical protein CALCODRAFT_55405 [Calocera cornea HHB12733]